MIVARIDGVDDPRVEVFRSLRRIQALRRDGRFVCEGARVVRQLLRSALPVHSLLVDERWLEELRPAARALDRVLLWEHYVIPHWSIHKWRVLYWNKFARPEVTPDYNICTECWWMKSAEPQAARGQPPLQEKKR